MPHILALDTSALGGFWDAEGYRQELERPSSCIVGLVAVHSPQALFPTNSHSIALLGMGCLWGILDEAHVTLLAVDPEVRRQGVGYTVLYGLLAIAHQRSLTRATLEVRVSNRAALSLYQQFGFQTAGRRPRYYANGEDALILWRSGLQTSAFVQTLQDRQQTSQARLLASGWPPLEILL